MMLVLAPIISNVPMAALAGVLMVTAWRMNEWHAIRYVFQHRFKGAIAKFAITMACTIVFDLTVQGNIARALKGEDVGTTVE